MLYLFETDHLFGIRMEPSEHGLIQARAGTYGNDHD